MNKFYSTLMVLAALAIAIPASAAECDISTSEPEVTVGDFYVDNDPCQPTCLFSIWIYQESNFMPGLQRNDDVKTDTCGNGELADTVIF